MLFLALCLGVCGRSETNVTIGTRSSEISKDIYYTTSGYAAVLSDNCMVVAEKGLRIINLSTKKVIKEIEVPDNFAMGYDIYGSKVVWSAYSSKEEIGKDPGYDETANTDIFLYDIEAKKEYLITGKEPQIAPAISASYIACTTSRQINAEIQVIKYK